MNLASMNNWSIQTSQELSDKQFQEWKVLVEEKTGMLLPDHRKTFLQSSLNIRMREINCKSYDQYFEQLASGMSGTVEWAVLVDRLTVHETNFFRHPESFDLVRNYLRRLIINRVKQNKAINIWSVGCSTGEEPYSIAILVEELISELQVELYYGITATDISLPSLSTARAGKYNERRLSGLNDFQKSFMFDKPAGEQYQVKQKYKDKICFARVNLLDLDSAPIDRVDVLFCQNVLIYFQKERKHEIVEKLSGSVEPGGLMVLGLGDVTGWCPDSMRRVKAPDILAFTKNI
jgi:chemotaxis protein methyltransferase CheR/type IV pilus assembly protein PilK